MCARVHAARVPHPTNTSTNGGQDRRGNATCVSHGRSLCARSSSRVLSLHAWHSGSLRRYTPRLCEMLGTVRRQRQHEQKQHRCFISSDCDHRGRQHVACCAAISRSVVDVMASADFWPSGPSRSSEIGKVLVTDDADALQPATRGLAAPFPFPSITISSTIRGGRLSIG